MKNNEKRRISAKKALLGAFILAISFFSFNYVNAVTPDTCAELSPSDCNGGMDVQGNNCVWDSYQLACFGSNMVQECSQKETWAGCFLKKGCAWYDTDTMPKCKPKSSKYLADSQWQEDDCLTMWNEKSAKDPDTGEWIGSYEVNKALKAELSKYDKIEQLKQVNLKGKNDGRYGDYRYFKNLSEYVVLGGGGESVKFEDDFAAAVACIYLTKDKSRTNGDVCDYPHWLNNKGKRKCRGYLKLKQKAKNEKCIEDVENYWQRGLKTAEDREYRREGLRECERISDYESYIYKEYSGPIFDGPGLRGGAQMAQMELSNSISKQRDIKKLLISWSKFALEIAAVVAVLALIYAGFRYITDMGDGGGVEAAKKIIIWTIVGLLLILSAYAIVNTVIKARFGAEGSRRSSQITINTIIT